MQGVGTVRASSVATLGAAHSPLTPDKMLYQLGLVMNTFYDYCNECWEHRSVRYALLFCLLSLLAGNGLAG